MVYSYTDNEKRFKPITDYDLTSLKNKIKGSLNIPSKIVDRKDLTKTNKFDDLIDLSKTNYGIWKLNLNGNIVYFNSKIGLVSYIMEQKNYSHEIIRDSSYSYYVNGKLFNNKYDLDLWVDKNLQTYFANSREEVKKHVGY